MSITVVGSIAFDSVETPFGQRDRMLGGAATHFALAASLLDQVRLVGPVGDDFGDAELAVLQTRGSNIDDVERVAGGKTFFWKGKYGWDLNTRETLDTQLNVFEHFSPKLSEASRASDILFLANIQPGLQLQVRRQCEAAKFVALDSMNLWIDIARDELLAIIGQVDCLVLNDEELRQLAGKPNLISAAHEILNWSPSAPSMVVAKQGEYGSALITKDDFFALPAYPLHTVVDPTGAGDTFAGGLSASSPGISAPGCPGTCCATRWPTARRSPRSTSSALAPRGWSRSRRRRCTSASPTSIASPASTRSPSS